MTSADSFSLRFTKSVRSLIQMNLTDYQQIPAVEEIKLHGFQLLSHEDVIQLEQMSAKERSPLDPMSASKVVNCQDES